MVDDGGVFSPRIDFGGERFTLGVGVVALDGFSGELGLEIDSAYPIESGRSGDLATLR
jgi:hypothetical protein